jgi:tetratricopeptide (TPR) repeat protein/Mrp family chromosome partitioning ATPase
MNAQTEKLPTLTRFVAFYSYKGGVGRTLALANCARALAAGGKKVVLLDFDLEAPGLLHFDAFQPKSNEKKPAGFAEYLEVCLQDGPPEKLDGYVHECKGKKDDQGKIWLMPAGRHGEPGYLAFLNSTTWSDFYTRQDGYKILENLRGHIIERYEPDYVFIDARTGLSEIGGIATHQLADIVVLVFNLNGQNLVGAKRVFDSIRKAPLHPAVILVASPVPVMPMDNGTPFAKKMQLIKRDFLGAYNNKDPLVIPYHPLLAFDDRLLVDDGDLFSSDAPYRRLAEIIQKVAAVDADYYLQQMAGPLQRGDSQRVKDIALQGLAENPTNIHLLMNLALAHYFIGMPEKAVSAIDELLRYHANSNELPKKQLVAQALFIKSVALGQLQGPEAAITAYDVLLQRFGKSSELALQEQVVKALSNKGITLGQLQRREEAIVVYDELLRRFDRSQVVVLQEQVANTLLNKGVTLGQLQRPEQAIVVCDELLRRFGESRGLVLQEQVAKAFLIKGITMGQLQRPEEAIAVFDELLRRFGESQAVVLQEQVAKALVSKGFTLGQLQRPEEAIAVFDELLRRFGESQALILQEQVANALNGKGFLMLLNAKKIYNSPMQRQSLLQAALNHFEQALVHTAAEARAMVLGNQGYALFLLGRTVESEQVLKEALALGGKTLYEAELADSHIDPLPEDTAFRVLLERLWSETGSETA